MSDITADSHSVFDGFYLDTIGYRVVAVHFDDSLVESAPVRLQNRFSVGNVLERNGRIRKNKSRYNARNIRLFVLGRL